MSHTPIDPAKLPFDQGVLSIAVYEVTHPAGEDGRSSTHTGYFSTKSAAESVAALGKGSWGSKGSVSRVKTLKVFQSADAYGGFQRSQEDLRRQVEELEERARALRSLLD